MKQPPVKEVHMRIQWTIAIAMFVAAAPLPAQPYGQGRWDLLGDLSVSDGAERDVLSVPGNRTYSQLRLCASRKPVRVFGLDVRFANGTRQSLPVRRYVLAGDCTRPLTIAGGNRNIDSLRIAYQAENFGVTRARVRVFAR
jgi:hypothetical protein